MSFLKKLFGGGPSEKPEPREAAPTAEIEYKGFAIKAMPFKEQGQYQTAGLIERVVDGALKQHKFVRADRSPSVEEVTQLALAKGRLMIDQQGDGVFG